jgi:hypothetical protein
MLISCINSTVVRIPCFSFPVWQHKKDQTMAIRAKLRKKERSENGENLKIMENHGLYRPKIKREKTVTPMLSLPNMAPNPMVSACSTLQC